MNNVELITLEVMRYLCVFFFNDSATTEIYTLSLHDALPICPEPRPAVYRQDLTDEPEDVRVDVVSLLGFPGVPPRVQRYRRNRSEEHTYELQSRLHLVCRLLLEKQKMIRIITIVSHVLTIAV